MFDIITKDSLEVLHFNNKLRVYVTMEFKSIDFDQ